MTISEWVTAGSTQLSKAGISTSRLDAELLLAYQLERSRTWLIAHRNDNIDDLNVLENASKLLKKRLNRIPLAYITSHKEFYNRSFFVDTSVLIPRPESETIIELLKDLIMHSEEAPTRLLDVGTGSGCLGITAKLEIPSISVTLSDISTDALTVARQNASELKADVNFVQSDLLTAFSNIEHRASSTSFDIIIANLPYVDRAWERSPETDHEPALALFAEDHGLELIKKCIQQARTLTSVNGYILLEADPEQHNEIIQFAASDFRHVETRGYVVLLQKMDT
jgi:release factor glutamine methyltransferase